VFSEVYCFQNNDLIQVSSQKVDLIFNRCNLHEITDCPVINSPSFYELCEDKYKTYLRFKELSAETQYVHNYESVDIACDELNIQIDELVVLKKNF
jgi:glutathione synthase/RimK-type ligase-like ATP-grasp enzyme